MKSVYLYTNVYLQPTGCVVFTTTAYIEVPPVQQFNTNIIYFIEKEQTAFVVIS